MSAEPPSQSRLEIRGVEAGWERSSVVRNTDLDVASGEIVALLGGNGSGKSTLLWAIAGLLRPRAGTISVDGRRIDGLGADRLARLGVRLLPQSKRIFPSLTVAENLAVTDLAPAADADGSHEQREEWLDLFPVLRSKLSDPAASLSGGEQQLLAIGRVVTTLPRVLLLDEPSAGLSTGWAAECFRAFAGLAAGGTTVVLVEQNVALARQLAHRSLRMHLGRPVDDV
ncbi:MAG TPA: ATP-binding cassette domain-containing protein [Acidimicrobiales bacterium]|nr:ATP-binding cassette domain-containing protein [Acidimicrobiales bacterium]